MAVPLLFRGCRNATARYVNFTARAFVMVQPIRRRLVPRAAAPDIEARRSLLILVPLVALLGGRPNRRNAMGSRRSQRRIGGQARILRLGLSILLLGGNCVVAGAQTTTVPQPTEYPRAACPTRHGGMTLMAPFSGGVDASSGTSH